MAAAVLRGGGRADGAKEALFRRTLAGLPADELAARARSFGLDHYRRRARSDVRDRLEWHRAQGHRLVIVSASPELYLEAVGRELDVDAVLATRLAVVARRPADRRLRRPELPGRGEACSGSGHWIDDTVGPGPRCFGPLGLRQQRRRPPAFGRGRCRGRRGSTGSLRGPPVVSTAGRSARRSPGPRPGPDGPGPLTGEPLGPQWASMGVIGTDQEPSPARPKKMAWRGQIRAR